MIRRKTIIFGIVFALMAMACAQGFAADREFDYSKEKVLHVVGTAHLDTQWRWTIQKTINEYIYNTMHDNFVLFEKYPNYKFSFEGAFRYMLMDEYYPGDFARMKQYIKDGRWYVCGSSLDAGDVNIPSPEAIMRNIMYGNHYYMRNFGVKSYDIFLPDCFGFGYALPTIIRHTGLKGFSTQKLTWGSSVGIPFDVGVWEGVDGSRITAGLNPDAYVDRVREDLSRSERWTDTIDKQKEISGLSVGYKYFGTGDIGGAPDDESVAWVEKSINGDGPLKVVNVPADRLFRELTPAQMDKLPHYNGEMLMTTHGTGCYTSQNAMKRWNRKNELLSDAVERASTAAAWLNGIEYPRELLRENWLRFVWHQFHDDLTGTSIPEAYEFSWNDEIICLNRSASMLENASGAVTRLLDTRVEDQPIVVYNPLAFSRSDIVEADIVFPDGAPSNVRVFDASGKEMLSQIAGVDGDTVTVLFTAETAPVSFNVFDVRASSKPCALESGLKATDGSIENSRYTVRFDENGDVSSIMDKAANKELLESPIRLALFENPSPVWPAWEILYDTVMADPVDYVSDVMSIKLVEEGPVRASVEIIRKAGDSTFRQTVSLTSGADRVEFENDIDWRSKNRLLKATFPLTVSNPTATYDLGLGAIERGNNTEKVYEVPAQQWADLTDAGGSYGVTIMNDCLYGWDKPVDNTLRLTMIHTPEPSSYSDQAMQDLGRHRMTFAVAGHTGDWSDDAYAVHEAERLNVPLLAFHTSKHPGEMGSSFSFMNVSTPQITVKALKMAEESDEIIVRLVESEGRSLTGAEIGFAWPVTSAREVNGAEEPVGEAIVRNGKLVCDFGSFEPKTFAVSIGRPDVALSIPMTIPFKLPYDTDVMSLDSKRTDGAMDDAGHTYSGDLVPETIVRQDIPFRMGSAEPGEMNAVTCKGQTIAFPATPGASRINRLYILAAASDGDTEGTFAIGDEQYTIGVQDYTEFVGQWDNRIVNGRKVNGAFQVTPGYIKRDRIGWVGTHRHCPMGNNEAYVFTYMYRYTIDLPRRARTITLPDNENIKVFAITAAVNYNDDVRTAQKLYDEFNATSVSLDGDTNGYFIGSVSFGLKSDPENAVIRYTTDGSDPTENSPRFSGTYTVDNDMTLKAKAFVEGIDDVRMMVMDFHKVAPKPAMKASGLKKGLRYGIYHGAWNKVPSFRRLKSVKRGTSNVIGIPDGTREDNFALNFTGYIDIPVDGIYTFSTMSDDGSLLFIDGEKIVDNDGTHGAQEVEGSIGLEAGKHKISAQFFEKGGGQSFEVFMWGPGITRGHIDPALLWHK